MPRRIEFGDAVGMGFGVGERERGAPGSAEHLPALDAQVLAQLSRYPPPGPKWCWLRAMRRACSCRSRAGRNSRCGIFRDERIGAVWDRSRRRDRRAEKRPACRRGCRSPRSRARGRVRPGAARVVGLDGRVKPGDRILHQGYGQRALGHCGQYTPCPQRARPPRCPCYSSSDGCCCIRSCIRCRIRDFI